MTMRRALMLLLPVAVLVTTPSLARPGGSWAGGSWGRPFGGDPWGNSWGPPRANNNAPDSREGRVDSDSFVAKDAQATLGHGKIAVTATPGSTASATDQSAYEAAVVDQLVKAGYDTATPNPADGQLVELRIVRDTVVPEEQKRKPVSGEASIGVSNWGTSYGMAVNVDLTKPKKALISTRLEARIKDRTSGATLWEGHATIDTREGDSHWTEQAIAVRLAAALFGGFPNGSGTVVAEG